MIKTTKTHKEKAEAKRIYGELPERPVHLSCEIKSIDPGFAAGKATLYRARLIMDMGDKEIYIPIVYAIPKSPDPLPAIIYLSYEKEIPNKYLPAEEIIDRGYAVFSFCIDDVTHNSPDFKSGIGKHIAPSRRKRLSPGKIALWAWVALRAAEYASDLEDIDKERIIFAGHGILARSSLLASGNSEKSRYVIANCLTENPVPFSTKCIKSGLTLRDFSYLYSPAFADDPTDDELDALIKMADDKYLLLGFSEESEFIPDYNYIYKMRHGGSSPIYSSPENEQNKIPALPQYINSGDLSYHIRFGSDYFSREDWNIYLDFIDKKA